MGLRLEVGEANVERPEELVPAFDEFLSRTWRAAVWTWPDRSWYGPAVRKSVAGDFGIGKFLPEGIENLSPDDPCVLFAFRVRDDSVHEALKTDRSVAPVHVCAEESNAERLRQRIRLVLREEPVAFSAAAVSCLTRLGSFADLLNDIAEGRASLGSGAFNLERAGQSFTFEVGGEDSPQSAFVRFVRAVTMGKNDRLGRRVPPSDQSWRVNDWPAWLERLKDSPLFDGLKDSYEWPEWYDVIRGVALELSARQRSPKVIPGSEGDAG